MKILNPETNREISVVSLGEVQPKEILVKLKAGAGTKEISWMFLSNKSSEKAIAKSLNGDSADNNFSLRIFEQALDWGIGISVLRVIRNTYKEYKKIPKPFGLFVSRKGYIFGKLQSGKVVKL